MRNEAHDIILLYMTKMWLMQMIIEKPSRNTHRHTHTLTSLTESVKFLLLCELHAKLLEPQHERKSNNNSNKKHIYDAEPDNAFNWRRKRQNKARLMHGSKTKWAYKYECTKTSNKKTLIIHCISSTVAKFYFVFGLFLVLLKCLSTWQKYYSSSLFADSNAALQWAWIISVSLVYVSVCVHSSLPAVPHSLYTIPFHPIPNNLWLYSFARSSCLPWT